MDPYNSFNPYASYRSAGLTGTTPPMPLPDLTATIFPMRYQTSTDPGPTTSPLSMGVAPLVTKAPIELDKHLNELNGYLFKIASMMGSLLPITPEALSERSPTTERGRTTESTLEKLFDVLVEYHLSWTNGWMNKDLKFREHPKAHSHSQLIEKLTKNLNLLRTSSEDSDRLKAAQTILKVVLDDIPALSADAQRALTKPRTASAPLTAPAKTMPPLSSATGAAAKVGTVAVAVTTAAAVAAKRPPFPPMHGPVAPPPPPRAAAAAAAVAAAPAVSRPTVPIAAAIDPRILAASLERARKEGTNKEIGAILNRGALTWDDGEGQSKMVTEFWPSSSSDRLVSSPAYSLDLDRRYQRFVRGNDQNKVRGIARSFLKPEFRALLPGFMRPNEGADGVFPTFDRSIGSNPQTAVGLGREGRQGIFPANHVGKRYILTEAPADHRSEPATRGHAKPAFYQMMIEQEMDAYVNVAETRDGQGAFKKRHFDLIGEGESLVVVAYDGSQYREYTVTCENQTKEDVNNSENEFSIFATVAPVKRSPPGAAAAPKRYQSVSVLADNGAFFVQRLRISSPGLPDRIVLQITANDSVSGSFFVKGARTAEFVRNHLRQEGLPLTARIIFGCKTGKDRSPVQLMLYELFDMVQNRIEYLKSQGIRPTVENVCQVDFSVVIQLKLMAICIAHMNQGDAGFESLNGTLLPAWLTGFWGTKESHRFGGDTNDATVNQAAGVLDPASAVIKAGYQMIDKHFRYYIETLCAGASVLDMEHDPKKLDFHGPVAVRKVPEMPGMPAAAAATARSPGPAALAKAAAPADPGVLDTIKFTIGGKEYTYPIRTGMTLEVWANTIRTATGSSLRVGGQRIEAQFTLDEQRTPLDHRRDLIRRLDFYLNMAPLTLG